jgi:hypothetical protein
MNTYTVHRKKGAPLRYQAHSYTEEADSGRIYFHKKEDKSDRDSFVLLSDISGVDEERAPMAIPSMGEFLSHPSTEHILRQYLDVIEKRKNGSKA